MFAFPVVTVGFSSLPRGYTHALPSGLLHFSSGKRERERENSLKAGEMVKQLKAPAAFAENTGLVLSMVARSCM